MIRESSALFQMVCSINLQTATTFINCLYFDFWTLFPTTEHVHCCTLEMQQILSQPSNFEAKRLKTHSVKVFKSIFEAFLTDIFPSHIDVSTCKIRVCRHQKATSCQCRELKCSSKSDLTFHINKFAFLRRHMKAFSKVSVLWNESLLDLLFSDLVWPSEHNE